MPLFRHPAAYPQQELHPLPPSTYLRQSVKSPNIEPEFHPSAQSAAPAPPPAKPIHDNSSRPIHRSISCASPKSGTRQTVSPSESLFHDFDRPEYNYRQPQAPQTPADLYLIRRGLGAPSAPEMDHPTGASLHTLARKRISPAQQRQHFRTSINTTRRHHFP